jgi:glutamyl-tRNA reductase
MVLGVDHRSAPTSVRENLAFTGECHGRGLGALKASFPDTEFVLLSTCNRVEVYAASESAPPEADELTSFLARFHGLPAESVAGHSVVNREEAAIGHLFRVATGLESLVPGEDQILGQVRDAYKAATGRGVIGPILHNVFQRALRAAKLARDETGLGRGKLSVASIAVDVARHVFDHFDSDRRERLEKARSLVEREAAACFAALRYRRDAGALLRQLASRTEAAVRRELDRLFLARPDLTDTQRAAIAQAMSHLPNQLLHHPRSALRAAVEGGDAADPHPLFDAARRVLGLADPPPANQVGPRRPGDRRLADSLA